MKRLKLNLDQLGKELEMLDNEHLRGIKGGWDGGYGAYGGYNSWEELWEAMQNGYVPPEGDYNPGGYGGYGDYGWDDYGNYGGYNGGWPWWYSPGGDYGGYGSYGGYGGYQPRKTLNTTAFKDVFGGINTAKENQGVYGAHYIAEWIGGNVYNNFISYSNYRNSCAFSLSLALNILGGEHAISANGNSTNSGDYQKDGIKEWYYYRASDMYNYLQTRYGQGQQVDSISDVPAGAEGFIYFDNFSNDSGVGVSDHIDYYDGTSVMGSDYSNRQGVSIYFIKTN